MMMFLQLCMFSLLLPMISSGMTPHEFVEEVNEKRKILAEKQHLGNMRELRWDKDLVVAVVDSWSDGTLKNKENLEIENIESFEEVLSTLSLSVEKDSQNLIDSAVVSRLHFLAPLHDKIGCSDLPVENANSMYCYFSPISPIKEVFDTFGAPGTRCSPGYEGVNGLCRFVKTTTTAPAPTTEKVAVTTVQPSTKTSDVVNQETAATTTAPEPTTERVTVDIAQQITKTSDIDHQKTSDSEITTHQTSADDAQSSGSTHSFLDNFLFFMFISFLLY